MILPVAARTTKLIVRYEKRLVAETHPPKGPATSARIEAKQQAGFLAREMKAETSREAGKSSISQVDDPAGGRNRVGVQKPKEVTFGYGCSFIHLRGAAAGATNSF